MKTATKTEVRCQLEQKFKSTAPGVTAERLNKASLRRGGAKLKSGPSKSQPISLDLSHQGLQSFDEIYDEIIDFAKTNVKTRYEFSNLDIQDIDLSHNKLSRFFCKEKEAQLYAKYKPLQRLESVKSLNLLNNLELESIKDCVDQVQALMPNLKGLQISLSLEEDVSYIMGKLPGLESLNGIEVEHEHLEGSPGNEPHLDRSPGDANGLDDGEQNSGNMTQLDEAEDFEQREDTGTDLNALAKKVSNNPAKAGTGAAQRFTKLEEADDLEHSTTKIRLHRIKEQAEEHGSEFKAESPEEEKEQKRDSTAFVSVNEVNQKQSPRGQGTVFEYNQDKSFHEGPGSIYDEELGADAAEGKTSKYTEEKAADVELDDTRDNISLQSDNEEEEKPNASPKKERQDMVRANQELLEYREDSVLETSSMLPPEQVDSGEDGLQSHSGIPVNRGRTSGRQSAENESPRSPNEQQMLEMEYLCQVLVEKQQLSEIVEDEREGEGDAALGSKESKGNSGAIQTLDSRNGGQAQAHSSGSSRDLFRSQVKGIGVGLVIAEEEAKEPGAVGGFASQSAKRSAHSPLRQGSTREGIIGQIEEVDEAKEAAASARYSEASQEKPPVQQIEFDGDDALPKLQPQDLEDVAAIFDRIRVLFRKKEDSILPPPKKLIAKNPGKVDDLAIEFDRKLTEIMVSLSAALKEKLVTTSQKWAEIEKGKYVLYDFCCETIIQYIAKHKASISGKEAKELQSILSKVREGLSSCFANLGSLFYSKAEQEVQKTCKAEMARVKAHLEGREAQLTQFEERLQRKFDEAQTRILELEQALQQRQASLEETENMRAQQIKKGDELSRQLKAMTDICNQLEEELACKNSDLKESQERLELAEKELLAVGRELRLGEERHREALKDHAEDSANAKVLENDYNELRIEHQRVLVELGAQVQQKELEIEALKGEKETELQNNLKEIQRIQDSHIAALLTKNQEIDRLTSMVEVLNTEIADKQCDLESINEENQRYLDMIIKYSLTGPYALNSKSLRQQLLGLRNSGKYCQKHAGNLNDATSIENRSVLCQSTYARSPLLPAGSTKNGRSLVKQRQSQLLKHTSEKSISPVKAVKSNRAMSITVSNYELQNCTAPGAKPASAKKRSRTKSKTRLSAQGSAAVSDPSRSPNGVTKDAQSWAFQDLAVGRLKKQDSQIIEKSCAKKKLQSELDSKAGSKSHDGHKISMDDCEPSPQKKAQKAPHHQALAATLPVNQSEADDQSEARGENLQTLGEKEVSKMIFGNDNSSVLVFNNQDSNTRKSLNINLLKQQEHAFALEVDLPNRNKVPQLQFGGIGFSFNEHSNKNIARVPTEGDQEPNSQAQATQDAAVIRASHTLSASKSQSETSKSAFVTAKAIDAQNQVLSTDEIHQPAPRRSKSNPSSHAANLKTVLSSLGEQAKIPGTSDAPVASVQANQAKQIQNIIRGKLRGSGGAWPSRQAALDDVETLIANSQQYQLGSNLVSPAFGEKQYPSLQAQTLNNGTLRGQKKGSHSITYTLKQIRDLITDIYQQKVKHDDKSVNMNNQTRETMEQYLYTYLNQKYGLRSIVIDQATAIIQAIADYQDQDHEVLLFGKVLRHEVDEEFRYVQLTIKSTICQLLKNYLREKHPQKALANINRMRMDIQNGKTLLDYSIWSKIVNHMYEPGDVEIIKASLRQQLQRKRQTSEGVNSKEPGHRAANFSLATESRAEDRRKDKTGSRGSVQASRPSLKASGLNSSQGSIGLSNCYVGQARKRVRGRAASSQATQLPQHPKALFSEFVETILGFQLGEHEKFLRKFLELYKMIDTDNDGVLSNEQFVDLYRQMNIDVSSSHEKFTEEVNNFLDMLDPFQCDKIILSDVVQLFSSYKVDILEGRNNTIHFNSGLDPNQTQNLTNLHQISEKIDSNDADSHFNSQSCQIVSKSQVYNDAEGTVIEKYHKNKQEVLEQEEQQLELDIKELEKQLYK